MICLTVSLVEAINLLDAFEFFDFFVVEHFSGVGVVVVHHELDAVDQGVDLVELVQPHRYLVVYVLLKFVRATYKNE